MLVTNMTQISLPNYADLSATLLETTLKLHASQVHGLISGILSGNKGDSHAWKELVTGGKDVPAVQQMLDDLYAASKSQLEEHLFEFQLVLPDDDQLLPVRAEALTLWCQGFLTGLKLAQVPVETRDESELSEAIQDLIEIAKMNYEEVVESDEDDDAYIELVEFVRVAAIFIYEDLRGVDACDIAHCSSQHLH
jgi:uncharacterized protein YgfB (UPF0149 family)